MPIALTSRADGPQSRVASALLALLVVQSNRQKNLATEQAAAAKRVLQELSQEA